MARSFFKPKKTSCFLIDLRSAISLDSNKGCSTALAIYLTVPPQKSLVEASLEKGTPSSSKGGAQVEAATQCSPLLSPSLVDLVCMPLGCLPPPPPLPPEFVLLGGIGSSCLYHLFAILIPLPFMVDGISLSGLRGWWGVKLCLSCLPSRLRLQQLLES